MLIKQKYFILTMYAIIRKTLALQMTNEEEKISLFIQGNMVFQ